MRDVPLEKISEYAAEDADVTLQLKEKLIPMLQKTGVKKVFEEVEMPLIPVLTDMELEGIRLDAKVLKELSGELTNDIIKAESEIQQMAGAQFNVSSPSRLKQKRDSTLRVKMYLAKWRTGIPSSAEFLTTANLLN
jgi:DNA polymerase-1